jgi:hypothetical protein
VSITTTPRDSESHDAMLADFTQALEQIACATPSILPFFRLSSLSTAALLRANEIRSASEYHDNPAR